jgi:excisionase family DNA binding protein
MPKKSEKTTKSAKPAKINQKAAPAAKGKETRNAPKTKPDEAESPRASASAPKVSNPAAEVPLVSVNEVATMLHMTPLQVRQMVQAGRLPGVKMDGEWRFNKALVYEALHRRSRGGK